MSSLSGSTDPHALRGQQAPIAQAVVESLALEMDDDGSILLERLWEDQAARWSSGEPISVEQYLEHLPDRLRDSLACDLIYGEWASRRRLGQSVELDEYLRRFAKYEQELQRQWRFDRAVAAAQEDIATDPAITDRTIGAADDDLPARIGRYVVLACLGAGGQATVLKAHDPNLSREAVIKISHRPLREKALQQWLAEGRILAELAHSNLAQVFDCGVHEGRAYLVMEYLAGRSLEQYAKERRASAESAISLLTKIADALAVAHRRGIVHCDIKPQNIIVAPSGEPKLIDFGFARLAEQWDETGHAGEVRGSAQYMAPEQAGGQVDPYDSRTDVFALGGVLYYLLAGQPPRNGAGLTELLAQARAGEWDRDVLDRLPTSRGVRHVVARALARDPASRYADAAAFADALRSLQRRRSATASLVLGLVVLAFGLAAWSMWPASGGESIESALPASPAIEVRAWRGEVYVDLADALPLVAGDTLRVEAEVPRGRFAALVMFTSSGRLVTLATLDADNDDRRMAYPAEHHLAAPLEGPSGTEIVLLCWRRDAPMTDHQLAELISPSVRLPQLPRASLLRLDPQGVRVEQRGRDLGRPVERANVESTIRQFLEDMSPQLSANFEYYEAIAFGNALGE